MIAAMASVGAYYCGRGWYRITGDDVPVRNLLHGIEWEPGIPPDDLFSIADRSLRLVGRSVWRV